MIFFKVIGDVELRVKDLMIDCSKDENIWIKRVAIEHQLNLKDKTDTNILEIIILNCIGSDKFLINKANGWALRDYSKTNHTWVRNFVHKYKDKLNILTIKEASKYLDK